MILTVASGKGGTGKTTVSVNLAVLAADSGHVVHFCDCDVEEPNAHLFLNPKWEEKKEITLPLPVVDQDRCSHCGQCAEICEFNAIISLPARTIVFDDLCHACSGCWLVCPEKAIAQGKRIIGETETGQAGKLRFTHGRLRIGETQVPPLVDAVKAAANSAHLVIRDAPPGVTCPAVATLHGSDFILLVTEPTPFGLSDLKAAVELVRDLNLPCAVLVNRHGSGDERVAEYCKTENLRLLKGVPFSREAAEAISRGELIVETVPAMRAAMAGVLEEILEMIEEASS